MESVDKENGVVRYDNFSPSIKNIEELSAILFEIKSSFELSEEKYPKGVEISLPLDDYLSVIRSTKYCEEATIVFSSGGDYNASLLFTSDYKLPFKVNICSE